MNTTEKILGITNREEKKESEGKITVTHITIRQSIFFLVLKLFALELFAAFAVIIFHVFIISPNILERVPAEISLFNIPLFILLVILKTLAMVYIIVLWLEEYYEITTKEVFHRKGFIIKKEERFTLDHIGTLKMEQDILGRIFNYGTLKLYDWSNEKDIYLYLIHNPLKYYKILKTLLPEADVEEKMLRRRIIDDDDE